MSKRLVDFVPTSFNFSELNDENNDELDAYELGDDMEQVKKTENSIVYDEMVANILTNLDDDRQKVVFLCTLLKDGGFKLSDTVLAKTMGISRSTYTFILKEVRLRAKIVMCGYTDYKEPQK